MIRKKAADLVQEKLAATMNNLNLTQAPPMTVKTFKDIFQMELEEKVIKRSIDMSSEAAKQFINDTLMKEKRNYGTQSLSIDGIFEDYRIQVEGLTKKLKAANINEKGMLAEIHRIADKL